MQFGLFTVSDITQDPTTGKTPSENERIKATVAIAKHAEEVGLDVFALGLIVYFGYSRRHSLLGKQQAAERAAATQ